MISQTLTSTDTKLSTFLNVTPSSGEVKTDNLFRENVEEKNEYSGMLTAVNSRTNLNSAPVYYNDSNSRIESESYSEDYLIQKRIFWIKNIISSLDDIVEHLDSIHVVLHWKYVKNMTSELWKYCDDPKSNECIVLGSIDFVQRDINWENLSENKINFLKDIYLSLKENGKVDDKLLKSITNKIKYSNFDTTLTTPDEYEES